IHHAADLHLWAEFRLLLRSISDEPDASSRNGSEDSEGSSSYSEGGDGDNSDMTPSVSFFNVVQVIPETLLYQGRPSDGLTPLGAAIAANNVEVVSLLLSRGVRPLANTKLGVSALHAAVVTVAFSKPDERLLRLILDRGTLLEDLDRPLAWDPLSVTAKRDRGSGVKLGWTPLHAAARGGCAFAVTALVNALVARDGAASSAADPARRDAPSRTGPLRTVLLRDQAGHTPLHAFAVSPADIPDTGSGGRDNREALQSDRAIVAALVEVAGADLAARDAQGRTAADLVGRRLARAQFTDPKRPRLQWRLEMLSRRVGAGGGAGKPDGASSV
ncbi:hypothetical protein HK405_006987, partial [Cladochytrium tenue]